MKFLAATLASAAFVAVTSMGAAGDYAGPIGDTQPQWSPNGAQIVFSSFRGGVYLENGRRLRTDEAFRERWNARNPELEQRADEWLLDQQARGEIRTDVSIEQIGKFFGLVADGVALHASMGFPVDVEPILVLVRDAIAPRD